MPHHWSPPTAASTPAIRSNHPSAREADSLCFDCAGAVVATGGAVTGAGVGVGGGGSAAGGGSGGAAFEFAGFFAVDFDAAPRLREVDRVCPGSKKCAGAVGPDKVITMSATGNM